HDQPLEAHLVGVPLDLRTRPARDRIEQLLELVLGAHELSGRERLEADAGGPGRLQVELCLERDPGRGDREEPVAGRILELLPPEESVPQPHATYETG